MDAIIPEEVLLNKIFEIRGQKVMIDRDLAELYGVETKRLKEAVRRNLLRFPKDFMFEMTKYEFDNWRSQIATSNSEKMGLRYLPFCFTEQGLTMLSCVLNSERAITINILVIRTFTKLREITMIENRILEKIEKVNGTVETHNEQIKALYEYLSQFLSTKKNKRSELGYKRR